MRQLEVFKYCLFGFIVLWLSKHTLIVAQTETPPPIDLDQETTTTPGLVPVVDTTTTPGLVPVVDTTTTPGLVPVVDTTTTPDPDPVVDTTTTPANTPRPGIRVFENVCVGCVVSSLTGFNIFPEDCTCFYTCVFVGSVKLSSMASEFVGYKRCCPCGTSFSLRRLGCVPYNSKLSECFGTDAANPCTGANHGDKVPRSDPFSAGPNATHCVGFNNCENFNGDVVPNPTCCPTNTCYNISTGQCTSTACMESPSCTVLTQRELDTNCDCDPTEAPDSECYYIPVEGTINQFMGVHAMFTYTCPSGMCWEQTVCSCVPANITVNVQCTEFLHIKFTGGRFDPVTGRGHQVWAINNGVNLTQEGAVFESEDFINVAGLASIHLGKTAVFHVRFTPTGGFPGGLECLFGNCLQTDTAVSLSETVLVLLGRETTTPLINNVSLVSVIVRYQNAVFDVNANQSMFVLGEANLQITIDQEYDFWLIICGDDDVAAMAVFDENDNLVTSDIEDVPDLESLIMEQSGFVFGVCPTAPQDFQGIISLVEFYDCKPQTPEFVEVAADLGLTI